MTDIQPVIPTLPKLRTQLRNKYTGLAPVLPRLPPAVTSSLLAIDTSRVARGQSPLTNPETINAVGAAVTGRPITPAPERDDSFNPLNLIGNFGRDVLAIGRSLPHLPGALVDEVRDLPKWTEIAAEDGFFQAPGIRMIPGAYTADAIAKGDLSSTIAQHPGFFAADVLPAIKGVKSIPLGEGKTVGSVTRASRPVAAVEGVARTAGRELAATRPGQFYQSSFGKPGRDISRLHAEHQAVYREASQNLTSDLTDTIYANVPEVGLLRKARELQETYSSIPAQRQAELVRLAEVGDWQSALNTLPDIEASYLRTMKESADELAAIEKTNGNLVDFKGEWYDRSTGRKLVKGQQKIDTATTLNSIRQTITTPTDLPTLTTHLTDTLTSDTLTRTAKRDGLRGVSYGLDAAGYNGQLLRDNLGLMSKKPNLTLDAAQQTMAEITTAGPNFGSLTPDQLITSLTPYRTNPNIRLAIDNIRSGAMSRARENVNAFLSSSAADPTTITALAAIPDHISSISRRNKYLRQTSQFDDKPVAKLQKKFDREQARTPPARFVPALQDKIKQGVLERHATDPDFDQMAKYIEEGQYSVSPEIMASAKALANDVRGTWQTLKASGHDPIFIAHVSPSAAKTLAYPKLPLGPRTPSHVKKRNVLDSAPYAENMSVALTHAAQEAVGRLGAEHFVDNFTSMYGRKRFAQDGAPGVEDVYRLKAEAEAAYNPGLNIQNRIDELINRELEAFDPSTLTPWKKARATSISAQDQILIPKAMAKTLKDIYDPKTYAIQGIMDPVMNLFRSSVLALSPRWQFNNLFGGALVVGAENPRIFSQLPNAIRMMRGADIKLPDGTTTSRTQLSRKGVTGTGAGSVSAEVAEWAKSGVLPPNTRIAQIAHQHAAGRTLRRLLDTGGKVINKSYSMNAWVDDMWRTMTYLHAYNKAVKAGRKTVNLADEMGDLAPPGPSIIAREAAEQAGLNLTRKMFQAWDSMTPFERDIMRYVFPFYGWVSHITGYAMRYPIDHPIRVGILSSVAGRELEDLQAQGLPDQFLNMFFLGDTDAEGNQKAISINAMNPFGDVGNNFTIQGLIGQANPIIGNFLQAIGIDPISGQAELYPDLQYDSETGRFTLAPTDAAGSFLGSVLPQSQVVLALVGANAKYNELLKSNPDSAATLLRSQAGLPVVFKNVPLVQTQMKSEINRKEAQTTALSEALKSGEIGQLQQRYPTLTPMLDQIRTLDEAGGLDGLRLDTTTAPNPTTPARFYDALVVRNLPNASSPQLAGAYAVQGELQRELPWVAPTP